MKPFKHLFFDLDNTILDFSHASHIAFEKVLEHFGYSDPESYTIYNEGNLLVWREFEIGKIDSSQLREKRFKVFLDRMGWQGNGLEWNAVYIHQVVQNNKYIEGAKEIVEMLSTKYDLHIVTNGLKEAQRPRIAHSGLEEYFKSITVSDEIGVAKPQSAFFKVAMQNAKINSPSEILMIGDSYGSDITGGVNYGLKTCWYNPNKKLIDSKIHDFEIHHISELTGILL